MPVAEYMVGTQVDAGGKMVPQNMGSQECAGPGMCGAGIAQGPARGAGGGRRLGGLGRGSLRLGIPLKRP